MQDIYQRRQEKLEHYRQQHEQKPHQAPVTGRNYYDDGEDEIDSARAPECQQLEMVG